MAKNLSLMRETVSSGGSSFRLPKGEKLSHSTPLFPNLMTLMNFTIKAMLTTEMIRKPISDIITFANNLILNRSYSFVISSLVFPSVTVYTAVMVLSHSSFGPL